MDGAFYIVEAAFFKQRTSFWALLGVVFAFLAYRSGSGRLAQLVGLAAPVVRPAFRAWRRTYFFNRGLANGLVMVHPLLVAVAYASLAASYAALYGLFPARGSLRGLARLGAWGSALALVLGAWWAQQELNWGGWWSWDLVELGSLGLLLALVGVLHWPRQLSLLPGLSVLFFYLGLRWGLFSSVHSFVVSGRGSRQGALALLFLLALLPALWGPGQGWRRPSNLSLATGGGAGPGCPCVP